MANPFYLDLLYNKRWEKYEAEVGIENPWAKYKKNIPKSVRSVEIVNGKEFPCWEITFPDEKIKLVPDDEERIAYRRQEYLWKAKIIQPRTKWEDFVDWVEYREGIELADFCPCESKDGQCSFECAKFGEKCNFGK